VLSLLFGSTIGVDLLAAAESDLIAQSNQVLQRFCFDCHGNDLAEGRLNVEQMVREPSLNTDFRDWIRITNAVEQKEMPPADMPQPSDDQRQLIGSAIRSELSRIRNQQAGDPGRVMLRRLSRAEYAYTISDLTNLDLSLQNHLAGDAVGGEGFANVGDVQFVQESAVERYLEAAKLVASHAVIGSGPLRFYQAPGKSGLELSAITRIQRIYREHGFRTAAGEGGEAFGLELYPNAFYVAWRFQHRSQLGSPNATLASIARDHGVSVRFAEHIWSIVSDRELSHPTSEIVAAWRKLPAPANAHDGIAKQARLQCRDVFQLVREWQTKLGQNVDDKEEAALLAVDTFNVRPTKSFILTPIRTQNVSEITIYLNVQIVLAGGERTGQTPLSPLVIWRNPAIQFRYEDLRLEDPKPIRPIVSKSDARRLAFGQHPNGVTIEPSDIVMTGAGRQSFAIPIPAGVRSVRLLVDAELDLKHGDDCIVQCSISDSIGAKNFKSVKGLLGNPYDHVFRNWAQGVRDFARALPQISHREPAPSDRDPIPPPYNGAYNNPERNAFHYKIKYHRNDQFLVDHILDDPSRTKLNHAWNDLLGSFEYHDTFVRFVAEKHQIDLGDRRIGDLDATWINAAPSASRKFLRRLSAEHASVQHAFEQAQPGHVDDVIAFAERAWRRPLRDQEGERLRRFYTTLREDFKLDHTHAIRTLLVRCLTSPVFLYRAEPLGEGESKSVVALTNWELASRLSYFLWSSQPDKELRRAAQAGELTNPDALARQAQRMLADPKARRFATEFFGQWLGFYQFDQYAGVDSRRFPEFGESLKTAMYNEAISFFEHIVRSDRPAGEIITADYVFVNEELAKHYGIKLDANGFTRIDRADRFQRGGLLGLGAVLTSTSAPLRTRPVKRGDWMLRRILDSPVPPPPADAGSIAADDVRKDGLTVRQRLEAHRQNASCMTCHSRIDPLGFALENYDVLGRWRDAYRDGQAIETSGKLSEGAVITGPNGLRDYLKEHEQQFQRTLCRKLLGYALGRRELLTDSALIEKMLADLANDGTFSTLVENIVKSKQFRYHRAK